MMNPTTPPDSTPCGLNPDPTCRVKSETPQTFRSVEELRSLYQQAGVSSDKNVITYCAVGMRAGHTWFVLSELLGHPQVTNYDRSWNEWGRQPDTPIEREAPGTGA